MSKGDSGDRQAWRAYEPPASPEPEPEIPPRPTDWRVYGDRYDAPGLRASTGQPTRAPAPPYSPQPPTHASALGTSLGHGWKKLSGTKKLRLVVGVVALVFWGLNSAFGIFDGDPTSRAGISQYDRPAREAVNPLKLRVLERFESTLLREQGTTTVTRVQLVPGAVFVDLPDEAGGLHTWWGRDLIGGPVRPQGSEAFDLALVDLEVVTAAAVRVRRDSAGSHSWRVSIEVPDAGGQPVITARAVNGKHGALIEMTATGEVLDERTW